MTTVTNNWALEQQLNNIVALALDFNKKHRGVSFSIEYGGYGSIKFVFMNDTVTKGTTEYLEQLSEKYGLRYTIVPLNGKLAITLSR